MILTFPFLLVSAVFLTGVITLLDKVIWQKQRDNQAALPWFVEYARAFFPILFVVLIIRSFLFSPYRIPTGSLEPTVMPGDFIIVSKYAYGLRLPVLGTKIVSTGEPKRGDVVLFHWPVDPSVIYAKRLVGLPGDHLQYHDKTLFINGKEANQTYMMATYDREPGEIAIPAIEKREQLTPSVNHLILLHRTGGQSTSFDVIVPPNHYFMMGDNRDNSSDSRIWGPVPDRYLIGKALVTWMSWDSNQFRIRWDRLGKRIH